MTRALSLLLASFLAAQDPTFDTESRLVMVPVNVLDRDGRHVEGLSARDFTIYDNGVAQRASVDAFTTGVAPIALVIAVQASGISAPVLEKVRKIGPMIEPVITGERGCAALLAFDDAVSWKSGCTREASALTQAFAQLQPGAIKRAHLLDAAHEAVSHLRKMRDMRRVLLLISESRDRGSEASLARVVANAQAAGVTVYAFTYSVTRTAFTTKTREGERLPEKAEPRAAGTTIPTNQGRVSLPPPEQRLDILGGFGEIFRLGKTRDTDVLAATTGGRTFSFTRQKGLEDAITRLGGELHTQYVLSFMPTDHSPGFHKLEVRVAGDFKVRARQGYWSMQ